MTFGSRDLAKGSSSHLDFQPNVLAWEEHWRKPVAHNCEAWVEHSVQVAGCAGGIASAAVEPVVPDVGKSSVGVDARVAAAE